MDAYGGNFKHKDCDWRFLTTSTERTLAPLLASWDQSVHKEYDTEGNFLGSFSHLLRVFLIDHNKQIRNIYSVSFLHADTVVNDIKTILLSDAAGALQATAAQGPGDDKRGYERADYQTHSRTVSNERGRPKRLAGAGSIAATRTAGTGSIGSRHIDRRENRPGS